MNHRQAINIQVHLPSHLQPPSGIETYRVLMSPPIRCAISMIRGRRYSRPCACNLERSGDASLQSTDPNPY